jgi:hypothetical protein
MDAVSKEDYPANFLLSYCLLKTEQQKDQEVKSLLCQSPKQYKTVTWKHGNHEYQLVVDNNRCIYIPKQLQQHACMWYHQMLMHPSKTQTELTITQHYMWKGMCKTVKHVCLRCDSCQHSKR